MMLENPKESEHSELFSTATILVHRFVEFFPLTVTSLTSLPTSHVRCHTWVFEALIPQPPGYRFQSAPGTNHSNVLRIFRFEANMQEWSQVLKLLIIIYCAVSLRCLFQFHLSCNIFRTEVCRYSKIYSQQALQKLSKLAPRKTFPDRKVPLSEGIEVSLGISLPCCRSLLNAWPCHESYRSATYLQLPQARCKN